ncbi:hypothetical protein WJX79_000796 [Trebouxia sp. C0005]
MKVTGSKVKDVLFGDYDYKFLCMPQWPWCLKEIHKGPPFFPSDEVLSVVVAAVMGLQHALAMVGGIVTPPLIIGYLQDDPKVANYLVASSLIVSGICTCVHVFGANIPFTRGRYMYGTGIISVIGTSFTFLNVSAASIGNMMSDGNTFIEAYGRILGTQLACCWVAVALSFMPPRMLRRCFPPMVTGLTIFLIGAGLIGTGLKAWGGGSVCQEYAEGLPPVQIDCRVPDASGAFTVNGTCFAASQTSYCTGNGEVELRFGSPEYVGLGALVFLLLVLLETFGSPFMRNCEVIIALLLGYMVSAVITSNGGQKYITSSDFSTAPSITFLWVKTFGFGFYAPAVLPFLIGFVLTTVEAIGDITATEEASALATFGDKHNRRVQGGLLGDGINSFFAALAGSLPNTTFAQNNGVLALTRCASRTAGYSCGIWLFLFGVLAKVGAFFTSIPQCVLGGMTTFLFAGVCVSGIKVISMDPLTRRSRFILCVAVGLGLGVTIVPNWATNNLWDVYPTTASGLAGFRNACILVLSNGFSVGCIISVLLHLALPFDAVDNVDADSASAVSTHVNPTAEGDITHQKGLVFAAPRISTHARKHGDEDVQAAGEWAALAYADKDDDVLAAELQQKLNQICNEGLKLMLKDSSTRELEEYKDKVSAVGAAFSKDNDMQGATFAYVLYKMAEHVQVEQIHNLQGVYETACLKMFGLLEDSGWALNKEGEEGTDRPQDENPLPDVPTLGSYSGIV